MDLNGNIMNRIILFKAKRLDNGEWVEGNLYVPNQMLGGVFISLDTTFIDTICDLDEDEEITKEMIESHEGIAIGKFIGVNHETVCQFTGGRDWRSKMIFENDILQDDKKEQWVVEYSNQNCGFILRNKKTNRIKEFLRLAATCNEDDNTVYFTGLEKIGNIHD